MKTLRQKIDDALRTSRQKWVKYPKELTGVTDKCGFCDEFGMGSNCNTCKALFWPKHGCVGKLYPCDSDGHEWGSNCDIMQGEFDRIEKEYEELNDGDAVVWPIRNVLWLVDCCVCGAEKTQYRINGKHFCASCLAKTGIDMSEYDAPVKIEKAKDSVKPCSIECVWLQCSDVGGGRFAYPKIIGHKFFAQFVGKRTKLTIEVLPDAD